MTTTRSKSVGRAAAAVRKAKHDQRTPPPPKGEAPSVTHTARVRQAAIEAGITEGVPSMNETVKARMEQHADGQAGEVKTRRDSGQTWREISEALALGAGKTGTSRARRLYRQANEGAAAPKKEPVRKARRATADPYADGMDSSRPATSRSRAASMPMVVLDRKRLHAVDNRSKAERGGRPAMAEVHTAEVGQAQVKGLRDLFAGDGYTVTVESLQADGTWAVI